ncbi:three component ABC system middle component [Agrobacterium sp. NPDC089420]|uniref:three component ABC system middle component n=1 Tax=Agrobacterium sp. NPDC089420 TaxID=3363918 RepID=UPI00384BACF3
MKYSAFYNNLGINAFAISSVLNKAVFLSQAQIALILPVVAHGQMVRQLAHAKFRVVSFEQYLIDNIGFFSNFNDRYTASITATVNSLQFLIELGVIQLKDDGAVILSELAFNKAMGKRAERINRASTNIAALVSGSAEIFYLNARIDL